MTKEEIFSYVSSLREESGREFLPVMREKTAAFLASLLSARMPAQVLEIGTCVGVSALTALAAAPCHLTTVEKDEDRLFRARIHFEKCGVLSRVTLINGDCNEVLGYLNGNIYDAVILDGPKSGLAGQYEECMRLTKKGSAFFIDDVNYHDLIKAEGAPHKQRTIILAMRAFIEKLTKDDRVSVTFYDVEDGFAVAERIQ